MSTLAERIAAKKAAALALQQEHDTVIAQLNDLDVKPAQSAVPMMEKTVENKPLTFAEKLALKRSKEAAELITAAASVLESQPIASVKAEIGPLGADPAPVQQNLSFAEKLARKKNAIAAAGSSPMAQAQAKPVREFYIDPERLPDDPETAQGLMDISKRIFDLEELIDDDLARAMSDLKDALRKNPAAAELILDEDVGKMVSSLRRMRHLSVAAATKEKKPAGAKTKPKAKEVALTTDEIAAAWDEL